MSVPLLYDIALQVSRGKTAFFKKGSYFLNGLPCRCSPAEAGRAANKARESKQLMPPTARPAANSTGAYPRAIALESSDINAAGFAMFKIKPKTENVSLSWAADAPSSMTVSQLQNADLTAKVISDGQVAENGKVNYTYKKKTFLCFSSKINGVPTEPGTYTQTAKAGGNYSCGSISRTITVTADPQPAAEQPAEQAAEQPAA